MLACGCMNPVDIMATLAGYGLLGLAGLAVGLVCLVGLLLGGIVAIGHLIRRWLGDDHVHGEVGPDEEPVGLASFRWEAVLDPREVRQESGPQG